MSTFDPMKARTPGSQATVIGPTKGRDPAWNLSNAQISNIRQRRQRSRRVEYKYLPSGSARTPRWMRRNYRYDDKTVSNYYKKKYPKGIPSNVITPAISRIIRDETGQRLPYSVPDSEKYLGSFDMFAFAKPGVSGADARLAGVRSFIDSGGAAFDLTQKDAQDMIRNGIMAYVKRKGANVEAPVVVASPVALQNFLSKNYKAKVSAGADRTQLEYEKRKPSYSFDDRFEYYSAIYGLNPRSSAFIYDPQSEKNIKRVEVKEKYPVVEKSTDPNKADKVTMKTGTTVEYEFDFEAMAAKYKDFREADAKWRGKIVDEIEDNGGARGLALWNKFLNGNANTTEVDELKTYMFSFSPQGTYADVQNRFFNEVQGINFSDIVRQTDEAERKKERASAATKRRLEEEAEQRLYQEEARLEFFTNVTPEEQYANARALIMQGRAEDIPPDVLESIKDSFNAPTGGDTSARNTTRSSEALGLEEDSTLGRLADILSGGQTVGTEINKATEDLRSAEYLRDRQKVDFINMVNKAIAGDANLSPEVVGLANEFFNDLGTERYNQIIGNSEDYMAFQTTTAEFALGKLAELGNAGPLSPTSAEAIRTNMNAWQATNEVKKNFAKSIVRTTAAIPYGLYSIVDNPMDALDAIKSDYERRYSGVDGFIDSSLEDPLAPILDLLTVVPVAGWATKGAQVAKVAAMTTKASRAGMSARQFAKVQRQVMVGSSPNAEAVMRVLMSEGNFGELNQMYSAGRIDRAATFFEPRYIALNVRDAVPDAEAGAFLDKLSQKYAAEAKERVYIRLAGNPASRGFQNAMLGFQKSKIGINFPLIGFQYRYGKAMRESDPFVSDMASREFMVERQLQELSKADLDDAEQMAAWAAAGGNGQGYAAFIATINRRLDEAEALGESFDMPQRAGGNEIRLLEVDYDRYKTLEFERRYRDAMASLLDVDDQGIPRTERGRRVAKMRDAMMLLSERNNRVLKGEADPRALAAFQRTYALILTASRLLPEDVVAELGVDGANVLRGGVMPMVNPNIRIPELLKTDVRQLSDADGNVVDLSVKGVAEFMDQVNDGFARLKEDMATRDSGGRPVLFLDESVKPVTVSTRTGRQRLEDVAVTGERLTDEVAGPRMTFYPMRYLRVEGNFDDADMTFERKGLVSDDIVWIPEWALARSRTGKVKFKSPAEGQIDIEVAIVNKMNKLFPNARDFVDKISTRGVRGPESFANRQNRNEVIASGLASYQFDVQLAASMRATQRRVTEFYEQTIEDTAVPISVRDYLDNQDRYIPLVNYRVFDNRAAAEAYATTRKQGDLEAQNVGTVDEIQVDGKTHYRVKMNYFDAMSMVLSEQRLQRLADWEQDISKHFIDTSMIRLLDAKELAELAPDDVAARYASLGLRDPNSYIMVIPKTIHKRFGESARRSNNKALKILYGASDLFKTFVLAISPRFINQQVVGSSIMLMIARPEWAPQIMASLLAKGAKNAAREATFKGRKMRREQRREIVDLAQLGDDYMILREIFADDFAGGNIFMEDMTVRGQRLTDLVNAVDRKAPSAARVMRPLLNNKPARVGGKVAKTIASFGYIIAFAFESALRAAIMKRAAMSDPLFAKFMNSQVVTDYMGTAVPERLIGKQTRFHAALRLISDRNSEFYNPFLLREMRYQADSVVGNYRWFTPAEKTVRDFLLPFYAWTRHSALFTKRLVQDRPITSNVMFNMGNYGYAEQLEAGGLPDWMLESIPLAGSIANVLGLDPNRANFVMSGSVNPLGQTGRSFAQVQGIIPGLRTDLGDLGNLTQGMNPYLVGGIAQQLGVDPLTGIPLTEEQKNQSLFGYYGDMYKSFPVLAQTANLFKTEMDLNEARDINSAEDIFVDPNDPQNSKLRAVPQRMSQRFPTATPAGLFNVFAPSRVMSLDPVMLDEMTKEQWEASGVLVEEQKKAFKSQRTKAAENLEEWRQLRDFIMTYYVPKFQNSDPEMVRIVLQQLREQYPSEAQLRGLTQSQISMILGGG